MTSGPRPKMTSGCGLRTDSSRLADQS
jgi:hypothetical protein